jgi:hypothetical protein
MEVKINMAGTFNKQNITVGAATIYLGASWDGTTPSVDPAPAYTTASYKSVLDADASWTNVGYTMEGLEVSYEPEYGDVEVDQILDSALTFKQSMRVSLNTTLAEATLYNLMIAWGQAPATYSSNASEANIDIDGGSLGGSAFERGLIAVGNGVHARDTQTDKTAFGERVYRAYRVLNVESVTTGHKRNEATGLPVSLRALPANNGLYGKIKDRKKTW